MGKQHTSGHAKAALARLLDELGDKAPALVRGDSGYGNEGILLTLEGRDQPCLLRLRQTKNVQRLVARQFSRQDWSLPDNQGCQMVEAQLPLHGWSKKRRVVIVRQRIRGGVARERRIDGKHGGAGAAGSRFKRPLSSHSTGRGVRTFGRAARPPSATPTSPTG